MRILTLGDSWTYGTNSSDPATMSWPAQLARKYNVEVVNLGRPGISNQRATRIGIEELCRDSNYDYVIFPLTPASRTELLNQGKWHQVWPNSGNSESLTDRLYTDYWHPFNDVQYTIQLSFYFMHSVKALGIPLHMTGLSLFPSQYATEMNWIMNYKNDNDFRSLNMPLEKFNLGITDLDRKLKSLRAIHQHNLQLQPDYLYDVISNYLKLEETQQKYNYSYKKFGGHPDDNGYAALADYFAQKIGLNSNT
jgi:hypothetical protein